MSQAEKPTSIENIEFGQRFVEAFDNLPVAEIARRLDITYQGAQNYAKGREPIAAMLRKISSSTGCSIHWLLTGEGEKHTGQVNGLNLPDEIAQALTRYAEQTQQPVASVTAELLTEALHSKGALRPQVVYTVCYDQSGLPMAEMPLVAFVNAAGLSLLRAPFTLVSMTEQPNYTPSTVAIRLDCDVDGFTTGQLLACRDLTSDDPQPGKLYLIENNGAVLLRRVVRLDDKRVWLSLAHSKTQSSFFSTELQFRYCVIGAQF